MTWKNHGEHTQEGKGCGSAAGQADDPEDAVRPVLVLGKMLLTCCGIIIAIPPIVFCIEYTINWSHE